MATLNRCVPEARTICGPGPLASDPSEFDWPERVPVVGCTRMVCLWCHAEVKSQVGLLLHLDWADKDRVRERAAWMHAHDDWRTIDGIVEKPWSRLYTCRCFYYAEASTSLTCDPELVDPSGEVTRHLPWTCAGHPPAELPVTIGAQVCADPAALATAIAAAADDPALAPTLRGLYFRTHHGSLEPLVPEAVAHAARGPGPLSAPLRALTIDEPRLAPLDRFVEELIAYQRAGRIASTGRRADLVDVLCAAVAQRPSGRVESGAIALLRDEALGGVTTPALLKTFSIHDRAWFTANLPALASKNPGAAGGVLAWGGRALLYTDPDHAAAIRQLADIARTTGQDAPTLRAQAEASLGDYFALDHDRGPILDALAQLG